MTDTAALRQQVIEDLLVLIRKFASDGLLHEIANGDSQALTSAPPRHLAALHDLRDAHDWRLNRQTVHGRHPREPIELIAYAVDGHSLAAQMFCNALLAVAELEDAARDNMHFRWFNAPGEAWFRALNDPWRDALIAAFALRHSEVCAMERKFWAGPDAKGQWIEPEGGFDD